MSNPETRFSSAHAINTCIPLFFCRTQNTFSSIPVAAQCFQVADEALVFCPFHGRAFEEHPITSNAIQSSSSICSSSGRGVKAGSVVGGAERK